MEAELHRLSNGTRVVIDEMPHTQLVSIGLQFAAGSRHETPDTNGAAHFLEHMMFKGTKTRTGLQCDRAAEDMGCSLDAETGRGHTTYTSYGLREHFVPITRLLSDIVVNAQLPAKEFTLERKVVLQEISEHEDSHDDITNGLALQTAYRDYMHGAPVAGTYETIKSMKRSALHDFKQAYYHTGNLIVSVAGAVKTAEVLDLLEETLADMPVSPSRILTVPQYIGGADHELMPTDTFCWSLGFEAPKAQHQDSFTVDVLMQILTNGMTARLPHELRHKRALVYDVDAAYDMSPEAGFGSIQLNTSAAQMKEIVPVVCAELCRMREEPVTDSELASVIRRIKVNFMMVADNVHDRMERNAHDVRLLGKPESMDRYFTAIETVTPADIQRVAQQLFSGTPTIASAGRASAARSLPKAVHRHLQL